ncbi:sulfurtransferase [Corynebacterium halotolerans]|uniref:Thiosulfate sulfurtransferase n=1 Tax=Corynebacterium halotolerans YIM 70093 = DSM 44683 TaxID=1121362 RepID=M1NQW1_9CORY|nr:sulfurtransferase [Corynebacterium halotolerans]AGF71907.1 thiosulfate sulfurtransferase [Corynebacterium halotolerans YIM 70093 = DSM 44683]
MATSNQTPLLIDAAWLNDHLDDPDVVVLDAATAFGTPPADGSGRDMYRRGHIPGAVHADLLGELADETSGLNATALPSERFAERIGALGVSDDSHVIVYDHGPMMWATRLWWNLRLEGHDRVSVLDGGFPAWQAAGYEVDTGDETPTVATFTARRRPELYADLERVRAALGDDSVVLIHSLDAATFTGESDDYARPGRIPGAVNIPFQTLTSDDGRAKDPDETRQGFLQAGALDEDKTPITYCGGGIAATFEAFQLARLGRDDVAVYDGSLTEWTADPSLPMETGEQRG